MDRTSTLGHPIFHEKVKWKNKRRTGKHQQIIVAVQSLSRVWLFATPWTAACQTSLSFTVSRSLLKLISVKSMMSSNHLILCHPLLLPSIFPSISSFPMSQLFVSGGQITRASALASVLPMNIQGSFPLGLTSLILLFKGLSRVFSSSTVQKHQFFGTLPSLWSNSHIHLWLLGKTKQNKTQLRLYGLLSARWCFCLWICFLGLS